MDINFETIGNATLVIYENNSPLIATDPWFDSDSAYFGSWRLSHKFPSHIRESIERSKYIFISHFHPDHLNLSSLRHCKNSTILLAQHYGSRVENELRNIGFKVITLPSSNWISIGNNTRIMLFNNEQQDSALIAELTDDSGQKSLVLNLNDSGAYGFEREVASISAKYKNSFYLQLHCWGDADMINLFDSEGKRIEPIAAKKFPVGRNIKAGMKRLNANIAIPFSSHHQYQRRDSFWANKYVTPLSLLNEGFVQDLNYKLLPAFQKIILKDGTYFAENINPEKLEIKEPVKESIFGDNWNDTLDERQINQCKDYFHSIIKLFSRFKSIKLEVGGIEHEMIEGGSGIATIKFSVPKTSLLKSIRNEIFDDLLVGNFMKTEISSSHNLYNPDFTNTVAKYSDNGGVKTKNELEKYFNYYRHKRSKSDLISTYIFGVTHKVADFIGNENLTRLKYLLRR